MDLTVEEALKILPSLQRSKLSAFTQTAFGIIDPSTNYLHNWHIDCICEHLEAVVRGDLQRLIINIPPRYLKSICVSVALPAWLLGRDPSYKILVGSYGAKLGLKHSVDTRRLMLSEWYQSLFPDTIISPDQNEKGKFQTTKQGHRIACSVGSGITGEGGDLLIVDDPHNPREAQSDVQREEALDWFDGTFCNRLNDKKNPKYVVIMQRLHYQDLTAHLLDKGDWTHLNIPVVASERKTYSIGEFEKTVDTGEVLHEEREDLQTLNRTRKDMGVYEFAGQYMQEPAPKGGGVFKQSYLLYYRQPEKIEDRKKFVSSMNIFILVDPAHEKKKTSDFSAFVVLGANYDNNLYLLDMVRDKLSPSERINTLFRLHRKWNSLSGKPPKAVYEVNGARSDGHYIREYMKQSMYYFTLVEVNHTQNKNDRIKQLEPYFQNGRILFPDGGIYHVDYTGENVNVLEVLIEQEMLTFPVGIHPDMLDAMAQILDEETGLYFPNAPTTIAEMEYYNAPPAYIDNRNTASWLDM